MNPTWVGVLIGIFTLTLTVLGIVVKLTMKLATSVESLKTLASRIPDLDSVSKMATEHQIRLTNLEKTVQERKPSVDSVPLLSSRLADLKEEVDELWEDHDSLSNRVSVLDGKISYLTPRGK